MDLGVRVIAPEGFCAGREEEGIVLAPDREKRPAGADKLLEFRIERDVALVVAEQIELDLVIAGAGEKRRIEGPGIRRQPLRVWHAMRVLPAGGFRLEEGAQRRAVAGGRILPVSLDRVPALAQ